MQYNLFFATEGNYLPYLFVVCKSILCNLEQRDTNPQDEIVFNILTNNTVDSSLVQDYIQSFKDSTEDAPVAFCFKLHIIDDSIFQNSTIIIREGWASYTTYYRICIDRFVSRDVEYAAYLDVDTLVISDIRNLFDQHKLDGKLLGAVVDPFAEKASINSTEDDCVFRAYKNDPSKSIKIPKANYFNGGMLLINLKEWRKQNIEAKCLELMPKVDLRYHDQDLLNYICLGQVELLDLSWNFQAPMFYAMYNQDTQKYDIIDALDYNCRWSTVSPSADEFERAIKNPNIIHFTGTKPWNNQVLYWFGLKDIKVTPSPQHHSYFLQWRRFNQMLPMAKEFHGITDNAITASDIQIYLHKKEIRKVKKRQRWSFWGLLILLILNLITLSLVIIK